MRPSRIHKVISIYLIIGAVFLPACARASQGEETAADVNIELTVDPSPATIGEATLYFELRDAQGQRIEGASLSAKGDMSHAGMMPVLGDSEEIGDGKYSIPFEWTMAGDWILTVTGELPDGMSINRTFELTVSSE
ncbi:MAG: FixH family protein [Anaerolineales bacterium]